MTKEQLNAVDGAALAQQHGGTFMVSSQHFRSHSAAESQKNRIIRKGKMYKVFVEGLLNPIGADNFVMFPAPDDNAAIERARSYAGYRPVWYDLADNVDYTMPFKLFRMNPAGADRFIYDYKPTEPKPHREVYVVAIANKHVVNNTTCFYAKNDADAIRYAQQSESCFWIKREYQDKLPENFVPVPFMLLHRGVVIHTYTPPADVEVNSEYLEFPIPI